MCIFRKNKQTDVVAGLTATIVGLKDQLADANDEIKTLNGSVDTLRRIINEKDDKMRRMADRNNKLQYKLDLLKKYVEDNGLEVPKEALNLISHDKRTDD